MSSWNERGRNRYESRQNFTKLKKKLITSPVRVRYSWFLFWFELNPLWTIKFYTFSVCFSWITYRLCLFVIQKIVRNFCDENELLSSSSFCFICFSMMLVYEWWVDHRLVFTILLLFRSILIIWCKMLREKKRILRKAINCYSSVHLWNWYENHLNHLFTMH